MIYGLMIAFIPLFLGYLVQTKNTRLLYWNNQITTYCLYLILFAMGIALGQLDNLMEQLPQIGTIALGMSVILHLCNLVFVLLYDKYSPMTRTISAEHQPLSRWRLFVDSLLLCSVVLCGGLIGFGLKGIVAFPIETSTYVLVVMIFCVGVQLRHSGIPLKAVFLNKRGILLSLIFIASGIVGGIIASFLFAIPLTHALAIASGFGWYSLSSVLLNDAWGAVYGSIAFFNDLSREIFCLFGIPFFMRRFPATAVSLGGATALDCTLPIIQKSGGIQIVPLAISFGFIINLAAPILLSFFIGLSH